MTDKKNFDTIKDHVNYFAFWLWEYQRRNPSYKKSFNEISKLPKFKRDSDETGAVVYIGPYKRTDIKYKQREQYQSFIENHYRYPKDLKEGISSEILLGALESKDIDKTNSNVINNWISDVSDLDFLAVKYLKLSVKHTRKIGNSTDYINSGELFHVEIKDNNDFEDYLNKLRFVNYSEKLNSITFEFDLSQGYNDVISSELEFLCQQKLYKAKPFYMIELDGEPRNKDEENLIKSYYIFINNCLEDYLSVYENTTISSKVGRAFPRAVGLSIYDYKNKNNLVKIKSKELFMQALEDKFDEDLYYNGNYKRYLENTERCIADIYLYNMTDN